MGTLGLRADVLRPAPLCAERGAASFRDGALSTAATRLPWLLIVCTHLSESHSMRPCIPAAMFWWDASVGTNGALGRQTGNRMPRLRTGDMASASHVMTDRVHPHARRDRRSRALRIYRAPLLSAAGQETAGGRRQVSLAHVQGLIREHLRCVHPRTRLFRYSILLHYSFAAPRAPPRRSCRSSVARDLEPTWQRHQRPQAGRWPRHSRSCSTTVATIRQRSRDTISAGVTRAPAAADT